MSFLQSFFFEYGYYAVFSVLVLCGMGLPLPEDITLVTAGIISALGEKNVHIMLVVAALTATASGIISFRRAKLIISSKKTGSLEA